MFKKLARLVFVPKCRCCGRPSPDHLCRRCAEKLSACRLADMGACAGKKLSGIEDVYGAYSYKDAAARAVTRAKFADPVPFLRSFLDDISIDIESILVQNNIDMVRAVPCHKSKLYRQETDIPLRMAEIISERTKVTLYKGLKKTRKTAAQHTLARADRRKNLQGAFEADGKAMGRNILLIDDVITSGSTMERCARRLARAGCRQVFAWAYTINSYGED